ncbi:MAG: transporter [Thermodesulfobacteriota bacterium]
MKKSFLIVALTSFIAASNALAYRPFATEDAGVAGEGVAQVEVSLDRLKWDNDDDEFVFMVAPIYGVTERLEVSAELPYLWHKPDTGDSESGAGDINLVAKYLLSEEDGTHPALAAKAVIKTASGDHKKGLGTGDEDLSLALAATKTIDKFKLHGQFGYTFVGDDKNSNLRDIILYGVAADYEVQKDLHLGVELNGNRHTDRTENTDPLNLLIGVIFNVSDKVAVDVSFKEGLNNESPDWGFGVGASITF